MDYPNIEYPPLEKGHLKNAAVFANRYELIESLRCNSGIIAEVGVAFGDFSNFLIEKLHPARFVAIDLFKIHEIETFWGRPTADLLNGMKHADYYRNKLSDFDKILIVEEGQSDDCLSRFPEKHFDLIYLDANHSYENVSKDLDACKKVIKDEGVIVCNDYVMYDHITGVPYGVVQATNSFIVKEGYEVIGFAFGSNMFCDIALTKCS